MEQTYLEEPVNPAQVESFESVDIDNTAVQQNQPIPHSLHQQKHNFKAGAS